MRVDGGVSSGSGEVLVLSVRDVKVGLGISVLLGEPEIDDVDLVSTLSDTHKAEERKGKEGQRRAKGV